MKNFFEAMLFEHEDKLYEGERIDLRQRYSVSEKEAFDGVATVYYDIYLHGRGKIIGSIDLRLTMNEDMYYYGHVGYEIIKKFRGHHYAYDACKLLFKIAKEEYKMDELFITCDPENVASYKTLEKLGGELLEVVEVPHDHELYGKGERFKCIFRYKINL